MSYNINSEEFLGTSTDMTGKIVNGFKIGDDIHIVYDIGSDKEWATSKPLKTIINRIDDYLFTPYASFAGEFLKLEDIK